ncbi:MAG: class I SAM-dependent methyltransferase [Methylobacter sp.]|jgi:SAM-dependent methyltransferase|nr:class I SAM-dependent methyltransferase [Methylobacter sp.]
MSEITHGLRSVLSYSRIYDFFQWIMGAKHGRAIFSSEYIKARDRDYVLDIGCGTAEIRLFLPDVEYFGFDPNAHYIEAAEKRLRESHKTGALLHATLDEAALVELPKFDIVLVSGVLHHLSDDEAIQLAKLVKSALKEGGRLITIDPCLVAGQSFIARYLVSHDRGEHVRDVEGYQGLMSSVFSSVACDVRHDLARFPYTHLMMECML